MLRPRINLPVIPRHNSPNQRRDSPLSAATIRARREMELRKASIETVKLAWLRAFLMLADCGRQTETAQHLGCTQPMVSTNLRSLEKWLGKKLFARGSGSTLTDEGEEFYPIARDVVDLLLEIRSSDAEPANAFSVAWLVAFVTVAKAQSHTTAGRELGSSQSTVSRDIGKLEQWLGKPLLVGYAPQSITKYGKSILPMAGTILELLKDARSVEASQHPIGTPKPVETYPMEKPFDLYCRLRQLLNRHYALTPQLLEAYHGLDKVFGKRFEGQPRPGEPKSGTPVPDIPDSWWAEHAPKKQQNVVHCVKTRLSRRHG